MSEKKIKMHDRKKSRRKKMRLFLFEVCFMLILCILSYFISLKHQIGYEALESNIFLPDREEAMYAEKSDIKTEFKSDTMQAVASDNKSVRKKEYRLFLIAGVDARDQTKMTRGVNADVLILVSLNERTGEIRMISLLRDTLLRLIDGGTYYPERLYDKINAQICYTDISDLVSMVNLNLDLNIQEYILVNWNAAARMIDLLGGVHVNIESTEILNYLNGYLTEVNKETGIFSPQLTDIGNQHLTGTQAVAFCRIRYAGLEDTGRTANQREILTQLLEQAKHIAKTHPASILKIVYQAAECIVTNLSLTDLGVLAMQFGEYRVVEHCAFPFYYVSGPAFEQIENLTGGVKDVIVADTLEENVVLLHRYLYGDLAEDYEVSEYVHKISEDIRWMSGIK